MKSHVRDLVELATRIYSDAVAKCTDVLPENRDLETIRSRVEEQSGGLSFLTITLPAFGKCFDLALAKGGFGTSDFAGFKRRKRSEAMPAFLQVMLSQVFDVNGGILNEPNVAAIEGVRQLAYTFKKLLVPCTPERVGRALTQFTDNEHVFRMPLDQGDVEYFLDVSRVLWSHVFGVGVNPLPYVRPKHGPGATAEQISGNAKFTVQRWHDRLEPYFPILDTAFVNSNARSSAEFKNVTIIDEDSEQPVRVIAVPKTLKTPRIIAIEPVCMQYTQQALSEYLEKTLETNDLTRGHVNFTDQSINRSLAIQSSRDEKFATLDLSSASDLVPYDLAIRMFDSIPDVQDAIKACRSKKAQLPTGEVIRLQKFASMGSALCFPVEAMYFYTICVVALLKKQNLPCTQEAIEKVASFVYVYGDDIIVPTNASVFVSSTLQKYYCKVNAHKSFTRGKFRESCGMDAYNGEEVTPTYVRHLCPRNMQNAAALASWVATSNLFYKKGYWTTASYLVKRVEAILGKLPVVGPQCSGLGLLSFQRVVSSERWNRRYQVPEIYTWTPTPVYRRDPLDGNSALLKSLLKLERSHSCAPTTNLGGLSTGADVLPSLAAIIAQDDKHLQRSARHGAVALKRRWARPY